MTPGFDVSYEQAAITVRTRKFILVSTALHLLLLLWMMVFKTITPDKPGLTEITWIEPPKPAPVELPNVLAKSGEASSKETPKEHPTLHKIKQLFRRPTPVADIAPNPQKDVAVDKIQQRLATLQRKRTDKPDDIAALTTPNPIGRPRLAGVAEPTHKKKPNELARTETGTPTPIELQRTKRKTQKAAILPSPVVDSQIDRAKPEVTESTAQRELAGAMMTGPVADRPIVSYTRPEYPEWAKDEAVEGSVTIYFVVLPNGTIKENVMVEKTSGFGDFDTNAINALLTWRFEPLPSGSTGEQWGTITFNYRLSDLN